MMDRRERIEFPNLKCFLDCFNDDYQLTFVGPCALHGK